MRNESSEKPLLSPDCVRAMDFANMCKQRLVLDLQLPVLTGKIGGIHSKQGFSEVSVISSQFAFPNQLFNSPFSGFRLWFHALPITRYLSLFSVFRRWTLDFGLALCYPSAITLHRFSTQRTPFTKIQTYSSDLNTSLVLSSPHTSTLAPAGMETSLLTALHSSPRALT